MKDPLPARESVREHCMLSARAFACPALLWGLSGVAWAVPAAAQSAPCSGAGVEAEPGLRAAHPALVGEVRRALADREGIEPCARVELGLERSAILVGVTLADGRSATRMIADSRDVVPVVEALLLVPAPEPEPEAPPAPGAKPTPKAAERPRPVRRILAPELTLQPPPAGSSRTGIEVSLAAGVRLGDGQSSLGLGAISFLELSSWLFGLGLRADHYESPIEAYSVAELMALFGHRFRVHRAAVDLVAGPALVLQADSTVEIGPMGESRQTGTEPVPRLAFAGHVHFGPPSSLHPFVGIEGEAGPTTVQDPHQSPQLPAWTLGVALGASVGTR
jgi:hypothetical protein